jgi:hypothetical protein
VCLEAALAGEQGREETDRPGAGDQRDSRFRTRRVLLRMMASPTKSAISKPVQNEFSLIARA